MQKTALLIFFLAAFNIVTFSQKLFSINGKLRDGGSGETIIAATISVSGRKTASAISNDYGFYSLSLPAGKYTLKVSCIGYKTFNQPIFLSKDTLINLSLEQATDKGILNTVIVNATKKNDIGNPEMGFTHLDLKEIATVPVIFGEADILKTLQLLPGVKSAGDGSAGFFVRGGTAGQNLILLDEAPVYNATHLFGFFSVFNSDAIKDVTFMKGNSPAQYGGRLASVVDVKMKDGNDQKTEVSGGIGLISSRVSVDGPIQKNKSSFLVTARRTYADLFLKLSNNKDINGNQLYFYDINLKANYQLNNKSQLFASGYFGKDKLGLGNQFGIDWGNQTGTLRWNYIASPKLFSNTSLIYSNYKYNILLTNDKTVFHIQSSIKDINLKQDFEWHSNNKSIWHFGVNTIYHGIAPTRFIGGNDSDNYTQEKETRFGWENALYANNTTQINSLINIDYGLRISAYSLLGQGNYNIYQNGQETGMVSLSQGQMGKTYFNIEPRFSSSFLLNKNNSLKFAYARNTQNLHLLSNSASTNPTDQWIGDSYNIKPEIADQISTGIYKDLQNHHYELSVETYYKWMQNQIDYKDGANLSTSTDVESQLLFGKGRAYGIEFYLKKKQGRLTGWLSYTLSRTERKINGINNNQWYDATQDQTHNLALVGIYKLSNNWSLSSNFVFYTGNAVSFPSGKYSIDNETVFYYTQRNGYRMPDYHRLDLSATYTRKKRKGFESSWVFSLFNVYGRENAYAIKFQDDPNDPSKTQAVQTSLFRWVPSITYNFKF